MNKTDAIFSINGPVISVKDTSSFQMMEMVFVGDEGLIGEVIAVNDDFTTIQVYEDTVGLKVGEVVKGSGAPLSVTLGPGILDNIFDGIERPLRSMEAASGAFISKGLHVASLDEEKLWDVTMVVKVGDALEPGAIIATCPETPVVTHKSMLHPLLAGKVIWAAENGQYNITQPILKLEDEAGAIHEVCLAHQWPVKQARPYARREPIGRPLVTGQRVIDTLFPIAKGGTAAIPGGFGAGKTITQHQIAKWSDADIVVYVGCGERGNEMTQVLEEFAELLDPKNNRPMTDRTTLIANTSNMPVAAREASIYTGITLAEYYRDMGYDVAIMADSTSRWAEALREISGRLEEMPAEEGFPAYLPSRIAGFYERAGTTLNLSGTMGSVTIIGAVSPQGADFSEPVTQNTKRFVRCFLALDKNLAYARHFPSINWNISYSEYYDDLDSYYEKNVDPEFSALRRRIMTLLNEETGLQEIVKLIGTDVLPENQKLTLEVARVVRTGFLQQNAYNQLDSYVTLTKQLEMMKLIMYLYDKTSQLVEDGARVEALSESEIFESVIKIKYEIPNDRLDMFDDYYSKIDRLVINAPKPSINR